MPKEKMPKLEKPIIESAAYAMDGGSISLSLRKDAGPSHMLLLVQHGIPLSPDDPRIPGRLYLDDRIIEIRSDEELELLSEIKKVSISPAQIRRSTSKGSNKPNLVATQDSADFLAATQISPQAAIQHLVNMHANFVEPEEYLQLADSYKKPRKSQ